MRCTEKEIDNPFANISLRELSIQGPISSIMCEKDDVLIQ